MNLKNPFNTNSITAQIYILYLKKKLTLSMMIPQIVRFAVDGTIIFLTMQLSEILHSYW